MLPSKRLLRLGILVSAVLVTALPAAAQQVGTPGAGLSAQSLRPYQFVFLAFALAWLLVLGWVVSVGRRLARLDRRLGS